MKYLVCSDLHGSHAAAKFIDNKSKDYDKIILLGDIYYHGPRNPFPDEYAPMKVADTLNSLKDKLVVVKGNCDSEVDQMISEFNFVPQFEMMEQGKKFFFSHGHNFNIDCPPSEKADFVFYGHFHIPFIKEDKGLVFVNPGSIALPKNNTPKSYTTIENNKIQIFDLEDNLIDEIKFWYSGDKLPNLKIDL